MWWLATTLLVKNATSTFFYEKGGTKHEQNVEDGWNQMCSNKSCIILDGEETGILILIIYIESNALSCKLKHA